MKISPDFLRDQKAILEKVHQIYPKLKIENKINKHPDFFQVVISIGSSGEEVWITDGETNKSVYLMLVRVYEDGDGAETKRSENVAYKDAPRFFAKLMSFIETPLVELEELIKEGDDALAEWGMPHSTMFDRELNQLKRELS